MKRQKRRTDKQLQRIIGIVCLSFLLGTAGGALLANLLPQGQQGQLSAFLQQALADGDEIGFAAIFWKYLKYDIIIWLGGWMQLGLFFAGAAFLFRSVCVGFTSAMMMAAYGMKGVSAAESSADSLLYPDDVRLCVLSAFLAGGGRQADAEARKKAKAAGILYSLWGVCTAACGGFWVGTDAFTAVRASYRKK